MTAVLGLLKPCYVFAPRALLRRVALALWTDQAPRRTVRMPWGAVLEVNPQEGIGRELFRQNIFDISVSEAAWRILRPGDLVLDVGANIGYMTSLFAARVGPSGVVHAFEPHPRIFPRLQRNVASLPSAGSAGVVLHDCALGDRDGAASLVEPEAFAFNEGAATIDRSLDSAGKSGVVNEVKMSRLDTVFGSERIKLLKIDVEGFEAEVLSGGKRLFAARSVANVIYEAHDRERSPLHSFFLERGYAIFGIGHTLFGLKMTPGAEAPAVERGWESPSYLATLDPGAVLPLLRGPGWRVLGYGR